MLDQKLLRNNLQEVADKLAKKGFKLNVVKLNGL